jgi:hypothetical protein
VYGGCWKLVVKNGRGRYLQGHSSETVGYLFLICSTVGHLFMYLFHMSVSQCASFNLHFDVFSHRVVRIEFSIGWVNVSRT